MALLTASISSRKVLVARVLAGIQTMLNNDPKRVKFGLVPDQSMFSGSPELPVFLVAPVANRTYQNTGVARAGEVTYLCQAVAKTASVVKEETGFKSISEISETAQAQLQSYRADEGKWSVIFSVIGEFEDVYTLDNDIFNSVGFYVDAKYGRTTE